MENTYILKVTVIRPVANRDSHAAPYVFWDLGRSYFILVLKIKLSYSNMQSQNLLRFFIPVLSLTPEDFFFPVPEYFLSEAKFVSAYPVQWEHQKQVIPFILQSLLQRTDITLPSVFFSLNIPHFMSFIIRLSKAFAFSVLICGVFPTSKFFKLSCSWSLPLALDEVILSQLVFAFFF